MARATAYCRSSEGAPSNPFNTSEGEDWASTFGAKEYSNRWAGAWRELIQKANPAGTYPPLANGSATSPLRPDQILNQLSSLQTCDTCPKGFAASPYNGWGAIPLVTSFQVPLDDATDAEMQQWVDMTENLAVAGCQREQYFDLGQEIVVAAMTSGAAWYPLAGAAGVVEAD